MRAQSPYTNESYRVEERANAELATSARNALPALLKVAEAAKAYLNAGSAMRCMEARADLDAALAELEAQ